MDWRALPPLTALRAFSAYAETGSVKRAGAALNVSHAAISQQLRALEHHLGISLLDRSGARMALTADGIALAQALAAGFGQIAQAVADLTATSDNRPLQVSVTPTLAASWLMPRLASFRAGHPDISLMIDPSVAVKPLEPGGIDIALRYGKGPWPGLESRLLLPSPVVVVAAPALVAGRTVTGPDDLTDLPWLLELGTSEATASLAGASFAALPSRATTTLPGHLMLEAARQGQGVAVTARSNIEADLAAGRLVVLHEQDFDKGYHVVTRPGVRRPALRHFIRWLEKEAAMA
ncbi:LysR family transcriptional regulator [Thalassococcus sp. CAU 1522]|uniref:LysR family transcriptional regulator n=1 Tax=Thalassococcus arenae TaxID=2851652 RepID=A0ABS6N8I4_9RHOB|nr:LysR family transcriptional regulator [Thalassococcus arenae]